jgi:Pin2-interacting protein X1
LKSQDPVHTRTGLDAFQGLLGRLNGKSDAELKNDVQKNEDRKLAMWAQGRWGGVIFVPGGKLVQGDGYKKSEEESKEELEPPAASRNRNDGLEVNDMVEHKAEKKKRKQEKRRKSEAESGTVEATASSAIPCPGLKEPEPHAEPTKSNFSTEKRSSKEKRKMKRERPSSSVDGNTRASTAGKEKGDSDIATSEGLSQTLTVAKTSAALPRTGRHVVRGRNIEAKKMAFSDAKMLDQVIYSWLALPCILTGLLDFHDQELNPDTNYVVHFPTRSQGTVHGKGGRRLHARRLNSADLSISPYMTGNRLIESTWSRPALSLCVSSAKHRCRLKHSRDSNMGEEWQRCHD